MPAWPVALAHEREELLGGVALVDHGVADVGPVETGDEAGRLGEPEASAHVVARLGVGGRRAGDDRHVGEQLAQAAQVDVLGTEVVAPLRDAVGLVDGKQGECGVTLGARAARAAVGAAEAPQALQKAVGHESFGRYVEQIELAAVQAGEHPAGFAGLE